MQVVSDIHLEMKTDFPNIQPMAPYLALLGDIGKPGTLLYQQFLQDVSKKFKLVFLLAGNHEYYGGCIPQIDSFIRSIAKSFPNVIFLQRDRFELNEDIVVLGCTLWSKIKDHVQLADFQYITDTVNNWEPGNDPDDILTHSHYRRLHTMDKMWLEYQINQVRQEGKRAIVLTHHGPAKIMSGKYFGSNCTSGFVSELDFLWQDSTVLAACSGHVHSNVITKIGSVQFVSNAYGYPDEEDVGYNDKLIVDI